MKKNILGGRESKRMGEEGRGYSVLHLHSDGEDPRVYYEYYKLLLINGTRLWEMEKRKRYIVMNS